MNKDGDLGFYSYISRAKVQQLHEQLNEITVREISRKKSNSGSSKVSAEAGGLLGFLKGGLDLSGSRAVEVSEVGSKSPVQMLGETLESISKYKKVLDLNSLCLENAGQKLDAFAYKYEGSFSSVATIPRSNEVEIVPNSSSMDSLGEISIMKTGLIDPAKEENSYAEVGPNNGKLVSDMCIVRSICNGFTILLACSYKYFSDMGGIWSDRSKEWHVTPHSGNYQFFEGDENLWFRSLIFITSVNKKTIMGTPLFLQHGIDPSARI